MDLHGFRHPGEFKERCTCSVQTTEIRLPAVSSSSAGPYKDPKLRDIHESDAREAYCYAP